MAAASSISISSLFLVTLLITVISLLPCSSTAQLSSTFYVSSCPNLQTIVRDEMMKAIKKQARNGASVLRLFFLDCFVNGCDETSPFAGGKIAAPNASEVIDAIKARLEAACTGNVSCADIISVAARDAAVLVGGSTWTEPVGRRDARTASQSSANSQIPLPFSNLSTLISTYATEGLTAEDKTVILGGHTINFARCPTFRSRVYNETNIDAAFATIGRRICSFC